MYCSTETLKLAFAKGYTKCSCTLGGYPDCICDGVPYGNVRLDDVQRWLREKHDKHAEVCHLKGNECIDYSHYYTVYFFRSYDAALEDAVVTALNFI